MFKESSNLLTAGRARVWPVWKWPWFLTNPGKKSFLKKEKKRKKLQLVFNMYLNVLFLSLKKQNKTKKTGIAHESHYALTCQWEDINLSVEAN